MDAEFYISQQAKERQNILRDIHRIILENDETITAEIEPMMGKEMILYKANGTMKYGLASTKNYMSLHLLPMYMAKALHEKYTRLFFLKLISRKDVLTLLMKLKCHCP